MGVASAAVADRRSLGVQAASTHPKRLVVGKSLSGRAIEQLLCRVSRAHLLCSRRRRAL